MIQLIFLCVVFMVCMHDLVSLQQRHTEIKLLLFCDRCNTDSIQINEKEENELSWVYKFSNVEREVKSPCKYCTLMLYMVKAKTFLRIQNSNFSHAISSQSIDHL